jgi:hypothetical protein
VRYYWSGSKHFENSFDLQVEESLGGWGGGSLGPDATGVITDTGIDTLDNHCFVGYRIELVVWYEGNWDLCKWGQDGSTHMFYFSDLNGNPTETVPYPAGPDMGSGPPYKTAVNSDGNSANYHAPGGGLGTFIAYDTPGHSVLKGLCVLMVWNLTGWAEGSDGSRGEDQLYLIFKKCCK